MFSLRNKKNYLWIILNTPLIWSSGTYCKTLTVSCNFILPYWLFRQKVQVKGAHDKMQVLEFSSNWEHVQWISILPKLNNASLSFCQSWNFWCYWMLLYCFYGSSLNCGQVIQLGLFLWHWLCWQARRRFPSYFFHRKGTWIFIPKYFFLKLTLIFVMDHSVIEFWLVGWLFWV